MERQIGHVYTWLLDAICRVGYPSDLLLLATKNGYKSDLELGLPHYHVKEINRYALHFIHHQTIKRERDISSAKISYIRGDACSINAVISDYCSVYFFKFWEE